MDKKIQNQTTFRENVILFLYHQELMDSKIDPFLEEYNFSSKEINAIDWINKKYAIIKKIIIKYLHQSWQWKRLSPLLRAVLIMGVFELNLQSPKIVINELVNYTKKFIPEPDKIKFVNAILDKIKNEVSRERKKENT